MPNSISSALIVATSGLKAAQASIDAVTRNVASAQVDGYNRKEVPLETVAAFDASGGVRAREIVRQVSSSLLRQFRTSASTTNRLETEDDFLSRFETIFGKPGDTINAAAKMGTLADAFRALSLSPDLSTNHFNIVQAAQDIAANFNQLSTTVRALREEADAAIKNSVDVINAALVQVADLNQQIASLKALNKSTAELEDKRDLQINIVAKEMDITYFEKDNGEIYISTSNGRGLLDAGFDEDNLPLSFTKTGAILPGTAYYPPPSTSYSELSGVRIGNTDISPELNQGNIAGYLRLRDEHLPETEAQLDELAARLIQKFNFLDLQIFRNGTLTVPNDLEVLDAGGLVAGSTTITISSSALSSTGLTAGMTMKFAGHDTVYEIVAIDSPAAGQVDIREIGTNTGLTADVSEFEDVTFGPQIPTFTNQTALVVGDGATVGTPIEMTGIVGAQVGTRIKFANHDTIYTITQVSPTGGLAANQFLIQPDGTGTGLRAAIAADETIRVLHPVPGVTGIASQITVNPTVINNMWRTRDGTRVDTPSSLTGNNTLPSAIIQMFETQQTFSANSGLNTTATLEAFAANVVSFEASRRNATQTELASQTLIRDTVDQRLKNDSGVNVDQELAFMLQVQNSYQASARVISTIREMMEELLQIV